MRAVLDTHLIVTQALSPASRAARIIQLFHEGRFVMVTSLPILGEYYHGLWHPMIRKHHRLSEKQINDLLFVFSQVPVESPPLPPGRPLPHIDMLMLCAIIGQADHLVSDDPVAQAEGEDYGVNVLSSVDFLALFSPVVNHHA